MPDLGELKDEEYAAYCAFQREQRPAEHHQVLPTKVREKREAWYAAIRAIKDAGYSRADERELLQARGSAGAAKQRRKR